MRILLLLFDIGKTKNENFKYNLIIGQFIVKNNIFLYVIVDKNEKIIFNFIPTRVVRHAF